MKFDSYHPAINLVFFAIVISATVCFDQPVLVALSFVCPFIYSIKLNGLRSLVFNLLLLPLIILTALVYCYFNHFGITNLSATFIGNKITLEALCYGLVCGIIGAGVLMWISCILTVVSSDKIIYLFGRMSPKLSLFLSITLRMVPHIAERAKKTSLARQGVGKGMNRGGLLHRIKSFFALISITITWIMENIAEMSDSMKSRGFTLKGRTAFSIYRFDKRDRSVVVLIAICASALLMGILLDQTKILYNPEILLGEITPLSCVLYVFYAALCLLPMLLQLYGEFRLMHKRKEK